MKYLKIVKYRVKQVESLTGLQSDTDICDNRNISTIIDRYVGIMITQRVTMTQFS